MNVKNLKQRNVTYLVNTGVSRKDALALLRITATLRKCSARTEDTEKPYWADCRGNRAMEMYRELAALGSLRTLKEKYPEMRVYPVSDGVYAVNVLEI